MKKSDLKKIIKPLVKECIHEVLLEEGLLSNVVSEVAKGMQANLIVEAAPANRPAPQKTQDNTAARKKLSEHRKKLLASINADAYNGVDLFEGTEPMSSRDSAASSCQAVLGNPNDSGVDISSLVGDASKIWKAIK